ncbi:1688_t:CDS:1, partial [Funneliformis caledonium]
RYAKLNQFFESLKQTERLEDAQKEIIIRQEKQGVTSNTTSSTKNNDQSNGESSNKPLKIL